jgi:P-type E1-E2 ATPase
MVGDGKNDALAVAKADLGMSRGLSPDLASPLTSVVLMDSDLRKISELFERARKSMRVVGQNLSSPLSSTLSALFLPSWA